jgi:hypothetical protein
VALDQQIFHEIAVSWDAGLGGPFAGELGVVSRAVVEMFLDIGVNDVLIPLEMASMAMGRFRRYLFILQTLVVDHIELGRVLRSHIAPASLGVCIAFVGDSHLFLVGEREELLALQLKIARRQHPFLNP